MPGGRKQYEPSEKDHRVVEAMAGCGFPQDAIARVLRIDAKTLRKHFRRSLDSAADKADAQVANTLFMLATSGKCAAATIFWMKARQRWKETARLEHSGPDGKTLVPVEAARTILAIAARTRPPEDPDETPITD
jgi:hypothetical protein